MYLFKIVNHAVHQPLAVYLRFASHGKSVEANGAADIGENRFHRPQPFTVEIATNHGVYFALHLLGKGVFAFFRATMEIGDLPDLSGFWCTEALTP